MTFVSRADDTAPKHFTDYICCLKKNYYKILHLDFTATIAEVKSAYRKLALVYHPDKTDNELLKAKFAEIKEAYDVLKDPVKRKNYDLTFDNFSYKKEVHLTPYQVLQKVIALRSKTARQDPHRMDLDKLEFEITEILSEQNTQTLSGTQDKEIVQQIIDELLEAARPLSPGPFFTTMQNLIPLASPSTREKIGRFQTKHAWDNRWKNYKLLFAVAAGILLCLIIYLVGK
jgi:hypothetical protein